MTTSRHTPSRFYRFLSLASGQESVPIGVTPRAEVYRRDRLVLYRYLRETPARYGPPVLIVYSLINRPSVLDLRPGRSVVQNLLEQGFEVYLLDWGIPDALDQHLDLDAHLNCLLRGAVRAACRHSGFERIHLLGYCMGGTLCGMFTALHPERIRTLTLLGAPFCFRSSQLLYRWGCDPDFFDPQRVVDACGNAPSWAFDGFGLLQLDKKPAKLAGLYDSLDNPAFLDSYLAMERWVGDNIPMAGAVYAEFIKTCFHENRLFEDRLEVGGRRVELGSIACPTLIIAGEADHLVPPETTCRLAEKVPQAEVMSHPSGHIGLSVSGGAQKKLWPRVGGWLQRQCNGPAAQ